jgi:hypothetical protein
MILTSYTNRIRFVLAPRVELVALSVFQRKRGSFGLVSELLGVKAKTFTALFDRLDIHTAIALNRPMETGHDRTHFGRSVLYSTWFGRYDLDQEVLNGCGYQVHIRERGISCGISFGANWLNELWLGASKRLHSTYR